MTDNDAEQVPVTTGEVISEPEVSGEWLSPPAAAVSLGISERTLWRHVNAGRYHKRTVNGRAEILVPGEAKVAPDNPDTASIAVRDNPDVVELGLRLSRQSRTVTRQAVQITRLTADRQRLQEQLAAAERRATEAEARAAELAARPFWKRWLGLE